MNVEFIGTAAIELDDAIEYYYLQLAYAGFYIISA